MNYTHYRSTRGGEKKTFEEILSSGVAENGGLYEPTRWPRKKLLQRFLTREPDFAQVVGAVVGLFAGRRSLPQLNFTALAHKAYEPFFSDAVVPLREVERDLWLLELFHGPTLSFKDIPLQFYGRLLEALSAQRRRLLIMIGATSGDTGSAAIEAMQHVRGVRLFMLHPKGRISEQQRRQMTCSQAPHICNIAVEGSYDDCLRLVKSAAQAEEVQARGQIAAVNSFNWIRIAVQSAVYLYAAQKMRKSTRRGARGGADTVGFALASGNFGNAYAGYVAQQLGAKISEINLAVSHNDFLHNLFQNAHTQQGEVVPSLAPSIDIMTPNNVERLFFRALGGKVRRWTKLRERSQDSDTLAVPKHAMRSDIFRLFRTQRFDDEHILEAMKQAYNSIGEPLDPHSAIALAAAKNARKEASVRDSCTIAFATASAAKFPQTVERAIGTLPHIPPKLKELEGKEERFESIPAEESALLEILVARLRTPLDTDENAAAVEKPVSTAAAVAPAATPQQAQKETATQDDASEKDSRTDREGVEESAENHAQKDDEKDKEEGSQKDDEKDKEESQMGSSMLGAFAAASSASMLEDFASTSSTSSTSSASVQPIPAVAALTEAEDTLEKKIAHLKKQTAQLDESLGKPLTSPSSFATSTSPSSFEKSAEQESEKKATAEENLSQPFSSAFSNDGKSSYETASFAPDVSATSLVDVASPSTEDAITSLADAAEQGQVSLQEKIDKLKEQSAKLDEPIGSMPSPSPSPFPAPNAERSQDFSSYAQNAAQNDAAQNSTQDATQDAAAAPAGGVLTGAEPFFSKPISVSSVSEGDTSVSAETTQDISGILPVEEEPKEPATSDAAESADNSLQDAWAEKK